MKKLTYILLSVTFALCSCSDDELASEKIIGSWNLKSVEVTNCQDADDNVPKDEADGDNCITIDPENDNVWCNFVLTVVAGGTANINYLEDGDVETENFTYTINDETEVINFCQDSDCFAAEFQGDNLVWLIDDDCEAELEFTM